VTLALRAALAPAAALDAGRSGRLSTTRGWTRRGTRRRPPWLAPLVLLRGPADRSEGPGLTSPAVVPPRARDGARSPAATRRVPRLTPGRARARVSTGAVRAPGAQTRGA